MIGRPEYTLSLPPPCPTNQDHLNLRALGLATRSDRCQVNSVSVHSRIAGQQLNQLSIVICT